MSKAKEALSKQGFEGIWLVEHPCDEKTKKEAKRSGCKIISMKFKDRIDPELVVKEIKRPKKPGPKPKAE